MQTDSYAGRDLTWIACAQASRRNGNTWRNKALTVLKRWHQCCRVQSERGLGRGPR